MPPDRRRSSRPFVALAVVAVLAVASIGGWIVLRGTAASSDQDAAASVAVPAVDVTAATPTTRASTTTTSTIPRQVAGERLLPGPATVYVLGDSVMLGAKDRVPAAMPGWTVTFDSKVSRRLDEGIAIVAGRPAPIARVLVVHLCTNWFGGDYRAEAAKLLDAAKGVERVVWVTCVPWRPEVQAADDVIRSLPDQYPQVVVADWRVIAGEPGYTAGDRLHLDGPGAIAMASLVAGTVGPAPSPG